MQTRTKIWLGIGSFAFVASAVHDGTLSGPDAAWSPLSSAQAQAAQGGEGGGEGGEGGGEGGEGGERGFDPATVANDPVQFLTALDVIAAHYLAGRDAYQAGDHEAGAEMLAHPISEVYVDLEPVFAAQGVDGLGASLDRAAGLGAEQKPADEVSQAVAEVLAALAAAERKAPGGGVTEAVQAKVMGEMIDRAAAMYRTAAAEPEGEAYLDGYGFYQAAKGRAGQLLPELERRDAAAAGAARDALDQLAAAYPSAHRPEPLPASPGEVQAAASRALLALGSL